MRFTVCEMNDSTTLFQEDWGQLIRHVAKEKSECVLLPEMPFSPWFAAGQNYDEAQWRRAVASHAEWLERLPGLGASIVLGTRAIEKSGKRLNEAFLWSRERGYHAMHHKFYLPNEQGVWEANWGHPGDGKFTTAVLNGAKFGYMICSELWFFEHARQYASEGVHILLAPRKTEKRTLDKWLVGGQAAAIVSGAFCLSSNSVTPTCEFGGRGWIISPNGVVLGITDSRQPFLTMDLDLRVAEKAKGTYPRNVAVPQESRRLPI